MMEDLHATTKAEDLHATTNAEDLRVTMKRTSEMEGLRMQYARKKLRLSHLRTGAMGVHGRWKYFVCMTYCLHKYKERAGASSELVRGLHMPNGGAVAAAV